MRAALYWAPAPDDPLWDLGCRWLGRDAATGDACAQPDLPGIAALTLEPRHYGFHATLRPPMRLAGSWASFQDAVLEVARGVAPFALPPLALADVHGFLALRESAPCPGLRALADRCITLTEPQRMAASAAELQRRRAGGLSARQDALLARWGYPYVMEEWFFSPDADAAVGAWRNGGCARGGGGVFRACAGGGAVGGGYLFVCGGRGRVSDC